MPVPLDVAVIGAGPAGAAAAATAASHGLRVAAFDKARFPRDKTCGDGLTAHALHLLERLGVDAATFTAMRPQRIAETVLRSPSGRTVELALPADGTHAAVVPRRILDAHVVELARAHGADVVEGRALRALDDDGDTVALHFDGDRVPVHARWVVAADGHWSSARRALHAGAPPQLGEWHAVRQYFTGVADTRLWVLFERDLLPGYAWVFPVGNDRANVGFGVLRGDGRRGRDLRALWPDLLARPALHAVLGTQACAAEPLRAWPIPTRYDPARLACGRVLFAGDAAGVADAMTGEGIAQALETGMLAADAILRGRDVAVSYRTAVQRALGRDLRLASLLQRVLRRPAGARAALRTVDATEWTRRCFARWMWEDYPRAVLATPSRWQRRMFTPAGAWAR